MKTMLVTCISLLLMAVQILATGPHQHHNSQKKSSSKHAGIVKHVHHVKHKMMSYGYMNMSMENNQSGTTSLSVNDVLEHYMVAPVKMSMDMHMIGGMIAPTPKLTVMAMVGYISKSMDNRKRDLTEFRRTSQGLGDIKIDTII